MEITIFSLCWNEEVILPYYFKHYKTIFPNAKFVIYDNMSTDNSREIIKKNGGVIFDFESNNQSREDLQMSVRNNCWKSASTDWVIVCDIDEFLEIESAYLSITKDTIIKAEGYEMVDDTYDLDKLKLGTRNNYLDKCILFNKKYVKEINYSNGCHDCEPIGIVNYNKKRVVLKHIKYFKLEYVIMRFETLAKRLSVENLENSWSLHYLQSKNELVNSYTFLANNKRTVPLSKYYNLIERYFSKHKKISFFNSVLKKLVFLPKGVRRK